MQQLFERIKEFFYDNPRMWAVLGVAVVVTGFTVWTISGGVGFGINRFFASEPAPTADVAQTPAEIPATPSSPAMSAMPTTALSANPSSLVAPGMVAFSWDTSPPSPSNVVYRCKGVATEGNAVSDLLLKDDFLGAGSVTAPITTTTTMVLECEARLISAELVTLGSWQSNPVQVVLNVAPKATVAAVPKAPVANDASSESSVCTRESRPQGDGWYCGSLNCKLDGNPGNVPPSEPAVRLETKFYHATCEDPTLQAQYGVTPPNPVIGCKGLLDATPKNAAGKEGYPPKDPLWTCTGPFDLGRSGADFYSCYVPSGKVTGPGPITCCANTGLPGDCFTFSASGGATPVPTTSLAPTPTASATPLAPLTCDPSTQSIPVGGIANVIAIGGTGAYTWDVTGGGLVDSGGAASIGVRYSLAGHKVLRVNSGGMSAACAVEVGTDNASTPPHIQKLGRNLTTSESTDSSAISVYPGQTAQFMIRVSNDGTQPLAGTTITDSVPPGMSYDGGSATVEGQSVSADTLLSSGIVLGRLNPGEEVIVRWNATADRTTDITAGPNRFTPPARVSAVGTAEAVSSMMVTVYGDGATSDAASSVTTDASSVPTGPGGAVIGSFILAAMLTLLYSGYTRSALYRRREVEAMSRDQSPMDFRS